MQIRFILLCGVSLVFCSLAFAEAPPAQDAATQPIGELMSSAGPGHYGDEAYRLINQRDEIVSVLRNGATVIARRVPSPVVSMRGYVSAGGVYEGKWLGGGLSHLLEHLVAGGSNAPRTEAENKNLLQKIGNDSNAYTVEDHTAFFVNTTTPHLDEAADLVTGWLLGASITVPEYRREYQVVQRELEMGKGEPDRQFWYLATMNRYRVSPAKVPVIGYQEVIQGLSRDDVYSYYRLAYVPNNMVYAIAGDVDPEVMLSTVRKYLADAKPGRDFSHDIASEPPVLAPRTLVATFPKLGQAKLELGFPSVTLNDPDLYVLDLLSTILGDGESSILVQDIRDNQQLVSNIGSGDNTPSYVTGTFQIDMDVDPDKIAAATAAVLAEVQKVKDQPIDEQRIARAKTQMKTGRLRGMQTSSDIAGSLATDFLSTGDPHFSDHYVDRIAAVTAQNLQAVARKYLDTGKLLTTVLMPAEAVGAAGLPKAEDLLRAQPATTQQSSPDLASAKVIRSELDNGTILLIKRLPSPIVAIHMYALGGVTAEDAKTNGLSNLTMEMLSRGTKSRSASQIAEFFDSTGGGMSSTCGNNSWTWTASCLKEEFAKTMEVYGDVVNQPAFPDSEVDLIRQIILSGIRKQDADWTAQAFRFFKSSFYGPSDSPYQYMAIGTPDNVSKFTTADMKAWYGDKILKARRVLAIYGDVDPDQARQLAQQYLGQGPKLDIAPNDAKGTSAESATVAAPPAGKPSIEVTAVKVQKTEQALAGIVIGFQSKSIIGEPDSPTFDVVQTLSGGYAYPTGYIFETLRGRGLVYVAATENVPGRSLKTPGTFLIYAGCDPRNVNEVVDLILLNIARMQGTEQDMQPDWFVRSKELIVTGDALEHETPDVQASSQALDELFGLGYDFHAHFADNIKAVTVTQVQDLCRTRLRQCVVTISTPSPDLVKTAVGTRQYGSFPPVDLTPKGVQHDVTAK